MSEPNGHQPVLEVKDLKIGFSTEDQFLVAVDGVSFSLQKGETLGIVGESGCGKSVTALGIMRLLPQPYGKIVTGKVYYKGRDLVQLEPKELYKIRGRRISMIFQEPLTALNPVHRVGKQICEVYRLHFPEMSESEIITKGVDLMRRVGIPAPKERFEEYPHQLSGGMRQRVVIAMALACRPDVLIADEPTTALDVTIQSQILALIKELQDEYGMAVIFITHDLGVIAEVSDHVLVMYGGHSVEHATVNALFEEPLHPYTHGLLNSIPKMESPRKIPLKTIPGIVPSLAKMPTGCHFHNRCTLVVDKCRQTVPSLDHAVQNHSVRCYRWQDVRSKKVLE